jgi:3-hydroxyacyl-CoA dehydrogenase / enoyl-CoA hydratase / 3-hydroxybutyryl-CoA epimerase
MAKLTNWTLSVDSDGVAWLGADKAAASANVLGRAVMTELGEALDDIAARSPKALVVFSEKPSGFIAGADIKEFVALTTPSQAYELIRIGQTTLDKLAALPCPTVAAIQGFALGGGLELALACTYRVAADDGKLSFGFPEVQLGIHPGFGGTVRAVNLIGVRPAMEMMLTGKPVKADRALALGLIDKLVPAVDLKSAAKSLVLASPPKRSAPWVDKLFSLGFVRPLIAKQIEAGVRAKARPEHYPAPFAIVDLWRRTGSRGAEAYEAEARSIASLMCTPQSRGLVRVFLLQDQLKSLAGKSKFDCKHVHVVGAGVMGGDIAAWCAFRGMTVTLQDRGAEFITPAIERAKTFFEKRLKDAKLAAQALGRLRADVAGDGISDADVIIEAIFENVQAKQALYATLESKAKTSAVLATNTSSLRLEDLCSTMRDPTRLVGIHFFNPVAQMQLVEIVKGDRTRDEVMGNALAFTRRLDKLPLPCRSAPGFVVNRILMPYLMEAMHAMKDGIPMSTIDAAGTAFGMPMGPIELADVVGLDVCLHVGKVLATAFGGEVPDALAKLVDAKKLGRKTGQGFYAWKDGKPVRGQALATQTPADLQDRLILPMLNEAVAVLREKVVDNADLLDAGVIFATGFAPFTGGPLSYAKSRGIPGIVARLSELESRYGRRFHPDAGWQSMASL